MPIVVCEYPRHYSVPTVGGEVHGRGTRWRAWTMAQTNLSLSRSRILGKCSGVDSGEENKQADRLRRVRAHLRCVCAQSHRACNRIRSSACTRTVLREWLRKSSERRRAHAHVHSTHTHHILEIGIKCRTGKHIFADSGNGVWRRVGTHNVRIE